MKKRNIKDEHDKGYKDILTQKKNFVQLLKSFVKEAWVNEIDESSLTLLNKSFIFKGYEKKEADIVYKMSIKGEYIIFYCLLELQSTVDFQMPIRLFYYMAGIWQDILKNTKPEEASKKGFKLPAILPMVLYNGEANWTVVRNFREILQGYKMFGNHVLDFNYILFNVDGYSEKELLDVCNMISSVFLLDKRFKDPQMLVDRMHKVLSSLSKMNEVELKLFLNWVKNIIKPRLPEELQHDFERIIDDADNVEVENMVSNLGLAG